MSSSQGHSKELLLLVLLIVLLSGHSIGSGQVGHYSHAGHLNTSYLIVTSTL